MRTRIYIKAVAGAAVCALLLCGCGGQVFENPPENEAMLGSVPVDIHISGSSYSNLASANKDAGNKVQGGVGKDVDTEVSTCEILMPSATGPDNYVDLRRDLNWKYNPATLDPPDPSVCSANPDSCIAYGVDALGPACYLWMSGYVSNIAKAERIEGTVTFNADFDLGDPTVSDQGFRIDIHIRDMQAQTYPLGEYGDIFEVSTFADDGTTNLHFDLGECDGSPSSEATVTLTDWGVAGPPDTRDFIDAALSNPLDGRKNLTVTGLSSRPPSSCLIKQNFEFLIPLYEVVASGTQGLEYGSIEDNIAYCTQKSVLCAEYGAAALDPPVFRDEAGSEILSDSIYSLAPYGVMADFAEAMDTATINTNTIFVESATLPMPNGVDPKPSAQQVTTVSGSGDQEFVSRFTTGEEQASALYQDWPMRWVVATGARSTSNKNLDEPATLYITANYTLSTSFVSDSALGYYPDRDAFGMDSADYASFAAAMTAGAITFQNSETTPHRVTFSDAGTNQQKGFRLYKNTSGVYGAIVSLEMEARDVGGFNEFSAAAFRDNDVAGIEIKNKQAGSAYENDIIFIGIGAFSDSAGDAVNRCAVFYVDSSAGDITAGNASYCPLWNGETVKLRLSYDFTVPATPVLAVQWWDRTGGWQDINGDMYANTTDGDDDPYPDFTAAHATWLKDDQLKRISLYFNSADISGNNNDYVSLTYVNFTNFEHATYSYETQ